MSPSSRLKLQGIFLVHDLEVHSRSASLPLSFSPISQQLLHFGKNSEVVRESVFVATLFSLDAC